MNWRGFSSAARLKFAWKVFFKKCFIKFMKITTFINFSVFWRKKLSMFQTKIACYKHDSKHGKWRNNSTAGKHDICLSLIPIIENFEFYYAIFLFDRSTFYSVGCLAIIILELLKYISYSLHVTNRVFCSRIELIFRSCARHYTHIINIFKDVYHSCMSKYINLLFEKQRHEHTLY